MTIRHGWAHIATGGSSIDGRRAKTAVFAKGESQRVGHVGAGILGQLSRAYEFVFDVIQVVVGIEWRSIGRFQIELGKVGRKHGFKFVANVEHLWVALLT